MSKGPLRKAFKNRSRPKPLQRLLKGRGRFALFETENTEAAAEEIEKAIRDFAEEYHTF